jgi:hypothetical protein
MIKHKLATMIGILMVLVPILWIIGVGVLKLFEYVPRVLHLDELTNTVLGMGVGVLYILIAQRLIKYGIYHDVWGKK